MFQLSDQVTFSGSLVDLGWLLMGYTEDWRGNMMEKYKTFWTFDEGTLFFKKQSCLFQILSPL